MMFYTVFAFLVLWILAIDDLERSAESIYNKARYIGEEIKKDNEFSMGRLLSFVHKPLRELFQSMFLFLVPAFADVIPCPTFLESLPPCE